MSVHQWVADGLMAVFFLLVGLEVKREWYVGRLATPAERRLPIIAAAAGMVVPAIVYLAVTGFNPALVRGWAIPSATDIAFAVGVLALLGSRANPSVKLLLVTIAIVDDVGAVLIIALVYTADLNAMAIGFAALLLGFMAALNLFGVRRLWPYLLGFAFLWYAMLASGIHATIAGVLAALTVPLGEASRTRRSSASSTVSIPGSCSKSCHSSASSALGFMSEASANSPGRCRWRSLPACSSASSSACSDSIG